MGGPKRQFRERAERANPVAAVHAWQSPRGAAVDITLLTQLHVYSSVHEHATQSLPNETGGFLLGRVAFDAQKRSWHVEVCEWVPVEPLSQDPVHFSFSWRDVDRVRTYREAGQKALVGWYHTHPHLGIFLSEPDLEKTHRVLFGEPFQVALVYDPVRHPAGFFFWEGPQIIDGSQAPWREFELAVAPEEPAPVPVPAGEVLEPSPQADNDAGPGAPGAETSIGPAE